MLCKSMLIFAHFARMYRYLYAYWNEDYWETTRHLPNIKVYESLLYHTYVHILEVKVLKMEIAKVLVKYARKSSKRFLFK
jgi:hypothetical protein